MVKTEPDVIELDKRRLNVKRKVITKPNIEPNKEHKQDVKPNMKFDRESNQDVHLALPFEHSSKGAQYKPDLLS